MEDRWREISTKKLFCGTVFVVLALDCMLGLMAVFDTVDISVMQLRISGVNPYIMIYNYALKKDNLPTWFWNSSFTELSKSLEVRGRHHAEKLPFGSKKNSSTKISNWVKFQRHISQYSLYHPDDPAVEGLLRDMANLPIVATEENSDGSQLKVNVKFDDGGWAVLKPNRTFGKGDRHYSEIAAFHLDRILGLYRVPPTVGRYVNIVTEIAPKLSQEFQQTVFKSEDGRTCFHGKCRLACTKRYAICGYPDIVPASLMHMLPNKPEYQLVIEGTRWNKRKYGLNRGWVSEEYLCRTTKEEYNASMPLLMEMLEIFYFDMLIDNWDRYELGIYHYFKSRTYAILFDNGKGFLDASIDFVIDDFLFDRGGCCLMKKTTFLKLLKLHLGPEKLSGLMEKSLQSDPLSPVLSQDHLLSLDRRVDKIMFYIKDCLKNRKFDDVILDDMPRS